VVFYLLLAIGGTIGAVNKSTYTTPSPSDQTGMIAACTAAAGDLLAASVPPVEVSRWSNATPTGYEASGTVNPALSAPGREGERLHFHCSAQDVGGTWKATAFSIDEFSSPA
jgi:hypothetical protein